MSNAPSRNDKLLVVDDDSRIRDLLRRYLMQEGFDVVLAEDGKALTRLLLRETVDLIVLDLMMPGEDGLSICRRLRAGNDNTPIIMLTAKGEDIDRIVGLEVGADDYLGKPFNPRELLARIHAVLRRRLPREAPGAPSSENEVVQFGPYTFDLGTRALQKNGEELPLTTGEFAMLKALVRHPRQPLSREKLALLARGRDAVPRSPMTFQEFVSSDLSRRRYWARSTVGWRAFGRARPNEAHLALARLGRLTPFTGVVTQNVDGLHQAAGSAPVLDLHGRLASVTCLSCGTVYDREDLQRRLLALNPSFAARLNDLAAQAMSLPDGDAEVDRTEDFAYADCDVCGGVLKPDVVYFGENASKEVVTAAFDLLDSSDALLVLGSSLTVMSGLRFVRRASRDGKPIVIINDGATRGDDLADHRLHGRLEDVLGDVLQTLEK